MISNIQTTELTWETIDNFSNTLKRFNFIEVQDRHIFVGQLFILLTEGPEVLKKHRLDNLLF